MLDPGRTQVVAGPFTARAREELVPAIGMRDFAAGAEGYVVALEAGTMELPPVRVRQIVPAEPPFFDCNEIDPSRVEIQRPVGMPDQGPGFLAEAAHPALTIARIRDAIAVPGGIALRGQYLLRDSFNADWEDRSHGHLSRDAAGDWHVIDRGLATGPVGPRISGPVLWLDHQNEGWFGHFIVDILTRAWAAEYCRAFLGIGRIRVFCGWPAPLYAPKLLEAAGVPLEDLAFADRPTHCEEMILATKALQIQHYATPVAARFWQRMRDRLAPENDEPVADRIYISRRGNPTRRMMEELGAETLFRRFGFTIVRPETMEIAEQVKLFAGARLIAGCSGSNMFNIAFARRAQAVMLLVSPLLVHYSEQLLLAGRDIALDVVMGFVEKSELILKPGYVHANWHLDLLLLEELVADWITRHG